MCFCCLRCKDWCLKAFVSAAQVFHEHWWNGSTEGKKIKQNMLIFSLWLAQKEQSLYCQDLKELGGFKQKEAESFVSLDNTDARHHWSQKSREGNAEAGHGFKFPRHLDQFIL